MRYIPHALFVFLLGFIPASIMGFLVVYVDNREMGYVLQRECIEVEYSEMYGEECIRHEITGSEPVMEESLRTGFFVGIAVGFFCFVISPTPKNYVK